MTDDVTAFESRLVESYVENLRQVARFETLTVKLYPPDDRLAGAEGLPITITTPDGRTHTGIVQSYERVDDLTYDVIVDWSHQP